MLILRKWKFMVQSLMKIWLLIMVIRRKEKRKRRGRRKKKRRRKNKLLAAAQKTSLGRAVLREPKNRSGFNENFIYI